MARPKFKNKHLKTSPHLGFKPTPPERLAKIPRFATYANKMTAGILPAEFDYSDSALASFLQMLGNNAAGDCTIAAVLKQAGLTSANRPGPKELVSNDREALTQYPQICGRGDQGCYIPDVLDWWRDKGLKVGGVTTKILGYVLVDPTNELEVAKALYLSGSLHAGLLITQRQYEEAAPDAVWEPDSSPIIGGHSIPLAGRSKKGWRFGTWAMKCYITQKALASPRAQTELYAVIDLQWFGQDGLNKFGIDAQRLKEDLETIAAGGDVPIPDPNPNPNPDPEPTPGGNLVLKGVLDFFGQKMPMELSGELPAKFGNGSTAEVAWFAVVIDVAAIISACKKRDWAAAAAAVEQLLTDLGLSLNREEKTQFYRTILARAETAVLCEEGPPNAETGLEPDEESE